LVYIGGRVGEYAGGGVLGGLFLLKFLAEAIVKEEYID
jgi:hypothetical protein